jgi:hypothetical protein
MSLIKVKARGQSADFETEIGGTTKNIIINGAMSVNQRVATSGITSGYFVDRFQLSGCSASAVITSSTPTEFPTAITVSATSGNPIILQKIESKNTKHLSGKVVTASFYAKNISNATTLYTSLQYAGSADSFGSTTTISEQNLGNLTNDWVRYSASWTVPAGGLNGLSLNILCAGSSTFTMGVTGVQLEVGSSATDFEHLPFAEELRLCQRYFCKSAPYSFLPDHNYDPDSVVVLVDMANGLMRSSRIYFPVKMRATPTITQLRAGTGFASSNGQWAWYQSGTWIFYAFNSGNANEDGFCAHGSVSGAGDGNAYWTHAAWKAEAEL